MNRHNKLVNQLRIEADALRYLQRFTDLAKLIDDAASAIEELDYKYQKALFDSVKISHERHNEE